MPSIISTCLKRAKKPIPFGKAIRVGAAVLLVMGVVDASRLLTRRESSPPARTAVRAPAAVQEAQRPQQSASQATVKKAEAKPAAKATAPISTVVTITGCLEQRDETFRLKDTDGTDAPKARTWKTAFLKKGRAPIEVVDAANKVKLSDHVGQRVNVTGTLVEREMQVRSLQRVSVSCSKNPSA